MAKSSDSTLQEMPLVYINEIKKWSKQASELSYDSWKGKVWLKTKAGY